ncbi:MAG: hypothetical protein PHC54_00780 [Candidatus Omnitrophica bacterium]|nr:hypothetical protein [Candidatus Omnitrophota bacterium]MDD5591887.1 hypothetical protein [Candidatus Omnitrophota bacterium]
MLSIRKNYIALFGRNEFENLNIILWCWIRNHCLTIIGSQIPPCINLIPFVRGYVKKSVKEYKTCLEDYEGLIYEIHAETVDLTNNFYNKIIGNDNKVISYYNRILNTDKFEAYIKREISNHVFILLKSLHSVRLSGLKERAILISKNPINDFMLGYMEAKYGVKYKIKHVFLLWEPFFLCLYYGWLFIEFIRRGVVFNKSIKDYKISKEAASGFYQKTLRDDIVVDNIKFKKSDLLILEFNNRYQDRVDNFFKEANKRGFDTVSVPELRININKNIFDILSFYFLLPLATYLRLLLNKKSYLFYYIFLFHKRCFPIEVLMNSYRIKYNISSINYDDNVTTIILNKYGAKNTIFNWSDLTAFKGYSYAFCAHNIYFTWSDIHYDFHSAYTFIDTKINIGCIFKQEFNQAIGNKEKIISQKLNIKNGGKIVTFFDNSFDDSLHLTSSFFLRYLEIIKEFCRNNKGINVLLKPKVDKQIVLRYLGERAAEYRKIYDGLTSCTNFFYLNPLEFGFEEALAVSDVCVSMGLNSPSTVALICGKNALYFDNTGNKCHPFAKKYENIFVFEDKDLLFKQLNDILNGRFTCRDVISEKEIREYDAFDDDKALERLRNNLYELTLSSQTAHQVN